MCIWVAKKVQSQSPTGYPLKPSNAPGKSFKRGFKGAGNDSPEKINVKPSFIIVARIRVVNITHISLSSVESMIVKGILRKSGKYVRKN